MDIGGSTSVSSEVTSEQAREIIDDNSLDKDAFFKLLITQLQNQDPLKPMEDKEFIAQMAQFSSLEQMQNMNDNMEKLLLNMRVADGANLIGKTVKSTSDAGVQEGKVTQVNFTNEGSYVVLEGGKKLPVEDINVLY